MVLPFLPAASEERNRGHRVRGGDQSALSSVCVLQAGHRDQSTSSHSDKGIAQNVFHELTVTVGIII